MHFRGALCVGDVFVCFSFIFCGSSCVVRLVFVGLLFAVGFGCFCYGRNMKFGRVLMWLCFLVISGGACVVWFSGVVVLCVSGYGFFVFLRGVSFVFFWFRSV